jgi:hypothetical protein
VASPEEAASLGCGVGKNIVRHGKHNNGDEIVQCQRCVQYDVGLMKPVVQKIRFIHEVQIGNKEE